ncbi:uncharacterized protein AB675_2333 [Cyphellophora attinorum]|uniref:Uncharacterized protein n=1 Tax=Cyphellophora attinorum TaxID=1664694 RepID=A0A0N1P1P9_9EURO|nr:uncharacterized protein AB675_2333 [Phialophora attinorum]KPI45230.1 hypothetical protein AB675_2333 [Phialophora attinorum]
MAAGEPCDHPSQDSPVPSVEEAMYLIKVYPDGDRVTAAKRVLRREFAQLFCRIAAKPTTYVLSYVEYDVLDYHRYRSRFDNTLTREARRRYWDSGGAHPSIQKTMECLQRSRKAQSANATQDSPEAHSVKTASSEKSSSISRARSTEGRPRLLKVPMNRKFACNNLARLPNQRTRAAFP